MPIKDIKLFINGRYGDAEGGETFESVNPANGQVIVRVARSIILIKLTFQ